jgi:hypothetical protein
LGEEDLTDRTLLQNCKLIFSILDIHSKPHISEEYKKIRVTEKSNVSHIGMYLKLFLILPADDIDMLAESAEELQLPLNIFQKVLLKMEALYSWGI